MKNTTARGTMRIPKRRRRSSFSFVWKSNVRLLVATMMIGLLCVTNLLIRSVSRTSPTITTTTITTTTTASTIQSRKASSSLKESFLQEPAPSSVKIISDNHPTILNSTTTTTATATQVVLPDNTNNNNMYYNEREQEELIEILQSLDYETKAICGGYKCFFRLKQHRNNENENDPNDPTSNSDTDNIAYLVSIKPIHGDGLQRLQQAYEMAQTLEKEYPQIKHFLLGPPKRLYNLTKEWSDTLSSNVIGQQKTVQKWLDSPPHNDTNKHRYGQRYLPNDNINIQKIQIAPTPHLIIGCEGGKFLETMRDVKQLVANSVIDKVNFIRRFEENINIVKEMVKKGGKYSCLVWDFQLVLDSYGNLYHIDLDRCFRHVQEEYDNTKCFRNMKKVIRSLKEMIS